MIYYKTAMKYLIVFTILACSSLANAQQYINPMKLGQSGDIILQNTNVYYSPMAPPDSTDVRDSLSNLGSLLVDPNGIGTSWDYTPRTHGQNLQDYKPCDTCAAYGPYAIWQRLFTARDKQDQSLSDRHSDIIVGDSVTDSTAHGVVTITKNEDVDFRASGTIKMESGFHVMPGAFFHAYIEPRWPSTPVFSDEFTDSTLDRSKWTVANGPDAGYEGKTFPRGSSDSNMHDTADPDAHDGHALDVILREDTGKFLFYDNHWPSGTCASASDTGKNYYIWSTAIIHSCPWPYTDEGDTTPVYQHAPYGKYEFREKIPHTMHHTNNWGFSDEYDLNETWGDNMSALHPGAGTARCYGPFTGSFGRKVISGNTNWVFRSSGPNWCWSNNPVCLIINGFTFNVLLDTSARDTCVYVPGWEHIKFPPSYANSNGTFTFSYQRSGTNTADVLPWTVTKASDGRWRIFSAGYHVVNGDTLRFSKDYQPTSVTLTYLGHETKTHSCHWEHTINSPDQGLIYLDSALDSTDLHSHTEPYTYTVTENNYGPNPPYAFNGDDTTGGYEYHTFGLELLPNEAIFLFDSNVVMREPDRMVPPSSKFFGVVSNIRRSPVSIFPAECDIDNSHNDPFGVDSSKNWWGGYNSDSYVERKYFEAHPHNPGLWDVTIGGKTYHAAHHLIDYVKIWDVPADVKVAPFPN